MKSGVFNMITFFFGPNYSFFYANGNIFERLFSEIMTIFSGAKLYVGHELGVAYVIIPFSSFSESKTF